MLPNTEQAFTKGSLLEHREVARFLPQRFPLLMVDRITEYEPHRWIRGHKVVSNWEPLLMPPSARYYPSGLIIESIGQLAIALFNISNQVTSPQDILLGSVFDIDILGRLTPGFRLDLFAEVAKELDNGFIFSGEASVNGQAVLTLGSLIAIVNPNSDRN